MAKGTRASPRGRSAAGGEGGQKQSEGLSLGRHGAGRQSSRGHVRSGDTGRADGRRAPRAAPHLRPREAAGWRRRAAPVRTAGVAAADTSPAAVRRGAAAASRRPLAAAGATERSPPGPAGPTPGGRGRASMCSREGAGPGERLLPGRPSAGHAEACGLVTEVGARCSPPLSPGFQVVGMWSRPFGHSLHSFESTHHVNRQAA